MSRLVSVVLAVCLCAAVIGTRAPGLFWLALVALAGILVAGALGVSLRLQAPRADGTASAEEHMTQPTPIGSRRRPQPSSALRRAA